MSAYIYERKNSGMRKRNRVTKSDNDLLLRCTHEMDPEL